MPSDHGPPPGLTLLTLWLNCSTIPPNPNPSKISTIPANLTKISTTPPNAFTKPSNTFKSLPNKLSIGTKQGEKMTNNPKKSRLYQTPKKMETQKSLEEYLCPLLVPSPSPLVNSYKFHIHIKLTCMVWGQFFLGDFAISAKYYLLLTSGELEV